MHYSKTEVVFLKVEGIPPDLKAELLEFIRLGVLHPAIRTNSHPDGDFTGVFATHRAKIITDWLESKGVKLVEEVSSVAVTE